MKILLVLLAIGIGLILPNITASIFHYISIKPYVINLFEVANSPLMSSLIIFVHDTLYIFVLYGAICFAAIKCEKFGINKVHIALIQAPSSMVSGGFLSTYFSHTSFSNEIFSNSISVIYHGLVSFGLFLLFWLLQTRETRKLNKQ